MDASFLYLERDSAPMHIGALAIVDGEIDTDAYLEQVEHRLRMLPRFKERIVPPPFYVGHPTWETDPNFDLARHMPVHALEAPGSIEQLRELTNRLIEGPMNRTRPLWEIHLIKGLSDGQTALVSKVHHAMVDGVGGNAIMLALYDLEPHPPAKALEDRYVASRPPGTIKRVGEAMWDGVRDQINVWSSHLTKLTEIGQAADMQSMRKTFTSLADSMPEMFMPPKRLPFNRRCNGKRDFTWTELSFSEARAIRRAIGGTVNDVVLTGLAGALAKYARHHGEDTTGRTASVMVPVNVRPEGQTGNLGNLVSIMPVRVPLDIDDPALRLHSVRSGTRNLKDSRIAEGVSMMTNLASSVPAPMQAAFGAMAASPYPPFNLVCTNVPGPQIPLYAQGHRLVANYPIVPVGFEMGVCCAIFSYAQTLYFGLNSDVGACGDIDVLRDFLDESFEELRALAATHDSEAEPLVLRRVPISRRNRAAGSKKSPAKARGKKKTARKKAVKKRTTKKAAAKKVTKKAPTKKKAVMKKSAKKAPSKKAKKKPAAKKTAAKKTAAKKTAAKKKVTKKKVTKKNVTKKRATKKSRARKSPAKKARVQAAGAKPTTRQATSKQATGTKPRRKKKAS